MIYLELLVTFLKIGLFSFGGGYGMIPIIEREIVARSWLTGQEFIDIISISEMTPGPIAVNMATFVGYRMGGIPGGAVATLGVVLPSLVLILTASYFLSKFRQNQIIGEVIYGIRPVVLALIIQATVLVAGNIFIREGARISFIFSQDRGTHLLEIISLPAVLISAASLLALLLSRIHPVFVILAAGITGVALHYLGVL